MHTFSSSVELKIRVADVSKDGPLRCFSSSLQNNGVEQRKGVPSPSSTSGVSENDEKSIKTEWTEVSQGHEETDWQFLGVSSYEDLVAGESYDKPSLSHICFPTHSKHDNHTKHFDHVDKLKLIQSAENSELDILCMEKPNDNKYFLENIKTGINENKERSIMLSAHVAEKVDALDLKKQMVEMSKLDISEACSGISIEEDISGTYSVNREAQSDINLLPTTTYQELNVMSSVNILDFPSDKKNTYTFNKNAIDNESLNKTTFSNDLKRMNINDPTGLHIPATYLQNCMEKHTVDNDIHSNQRKIMQPEKVTKNINQLDLTEPIHTEKTTGLNKEMIGQIPLEMSLSKCNNSSTKYCKSVPLEIREDLEENESLFCTKISEPFVIHTEVADIVMEPVETNAKNLQNTNATALSPGSIELENLEATIERILSEVALQESLLVEQNNFEHVPNVEHEIEYKPNVSSLFKEEDTIEMSFPNRPEKTNTNKTANQDSQLLLKQKYCKPIFANEPDKILDSSESSVSLTSAVDWLMENNSTEEFYTLDEKPEPTGNPQVLENKMLHKDSNLQMVEATVSTLVAEIKNHEAKLLQSFHSKNKTDLGESETSSYWKELQRTVEICPGRQRSNNTPTMKESTWQGVTSKEQCSDNEEYKVNATMFQGNNDKHANPCNLTAKYLLNKAHNDKLIRNKSETEENREIRAEIKLLVKTSEVGKEAIEIHSVCEYVDDSQNSTKNKQFSNIFANCNSTENLSSNASVNIEQDHVKLQKPRFLNVSNTSQSTNPSVEKNQQTIKKLCVRSPNFEITKTYANIPEMTKPILKCQVASLPSLQNLAKSLVPFTPKMKRALSNESSSDSSSSSTPLISPVSKAISLPSLQHLRRSPNHSPVCATPPISVTYNPPEPWYLQTEFLFSPSDIPSGYCTWCPHSQPVGDETGSTGRTSSETQVTHTVKHVKHDPLVLEASQIPSPQQDDQSKEMFVPVHGIKPKTKYLSTSEDISIVDQIVRESQTGSDKQDHTLVITEIGHGPKEAKNLTTEVENGKEIGKYMKEVVEEEQKLQSIDNIPDSIPTMKQVRDVISISETVTKEGEKIKEVVDTIKISETFDHEPLRDITVTELEHVSGVSNELQEDEIKTFVDNTKIGIFSDVLDNVMDLKKIKPEVEQIDGDSRNLQDMFKPEAVAQTEVVCEIKKASLGDVLDPGLLEGIGTPLAKQVRTDPIEETVPSVTDSSQNETTQFVISPNLQQCGLNGSSHRPVVEISQLLSKECEEEKKEAYIVTEPIDDKVLNVEHEIEDRRSESSSPDTLSDKPIPLTCTITDPLVKRRPMFHIESEEDDVADQLVNLSDPDFDKELFLQSNQELKLETGQIITVTDIDFDYDTKKVASDNQQEDIGSSTSPAPVVIGESANSEGNIENIKENMEDIYKILDESQPLLHEIETEKSLDLQLIGLKLTKDLPNEGKEDVSTGGEGVPQENEGMSSTDINKHEKKLRRVERRFERMASETLEGDTVEGSTPEVEQRREAEFQRMISQLSTEEVADCQKEYLQLWDEGGLTPSEDWDSRDPETPSGELDEDSPPQEQGDIPASEWKLQHTPHEETPVRANVPPSRCLPLHDISIDDDTEVDLWEHDWRFQVQHSVGGVEETTVPESDAAGVSVQTVQTRTADGGIVTTTTRTTVTQLSSESAVQDLLNQTKPDPKKESKPE